MGRFRPLVPPFQWKHLPKVLRNLSNAMTEFTTNFDYVPTAESDSKTLIESLT